MSDRFFIASDEVVYLDGNRSGRLPLATTDRVETLMRQGWGTDLIGGWNHDWIHLPRKIGDRIGTIIGAVAGQCVVADSTSVNLFKLATAALRFQPTRSKMITDATNFPSDLYVLQSTAGASGANRQFGSGR